MPMTDTKLREALWWIAAGHKSDFAGVASGNPGLQRVGADARKVARAALDAAPEADTKPRDQWRLQRAMSVCESAAVPTLECRCGVGQPCALADEIHDAMLEAEQRAAQESGR